MIEGLSALGSAGPSRPSARAGRAPPHRPRASASSRRLARRSARRSIRCKTGEAVAIQGVQGAAPPMKVVESVMEAQRSLQSVLAIRDKIVSA